MEGRALLDRRLKQRLVAFVVALGMLLTLNNLLPYLGMRDDSCQTMFSSLEWWNGGNNHVYMPQRMASDLWAYHHEVSVELDPPVEGFGRVHDLEMWLSQDDRVLNTEAVRVVVRQICERGHRVAMSWKPGRDAEPRHTDNACEVPELSEPHSWIPVRLYETDFEPRPNTP